MPIDEALFSVTQFTCDLPEMRSAPAWRLAPGVLRQVQRPRIANSK